MSTQGEYPSLFLRYALAKIANLVGRLDLCETAVWEEASLVLHTLSELTCSGTLDLESVETVLKAQKHVIQNIRVLLQEDLFRIYTIIAKTVKLLVFSDAVVFEIDDFTTTSYILKSMLKNTFELSESSLHDSGFECFIRVTEIVIKICNRLENFSSTGDNISICLQSLFEEHIVPLPFKHIIGDIPDNTKIYEVSVASISMVLAFFTVIKNDDRMALLGKLLKQKWLTFCFSVLDYSGMNSVRSLTWKLIGLLTTSEAAIGENSAFFNSFKYSEAYPFSSLDDAIDCICSDKLDHALDSKNAFVIKMGVMEILYVAIRHENTIITDVELKRCITIFIEKYGDLLVQKSASYNVLLFLIDRVYKDELNEEKITTTFTQYDKLLENSSIRSFTRVMPATSQSKLIMSREAIIPRAPVLLLKSWIMRCWSFPISIQQLEDELSDDSGKKLTHKPSIYFGEIVFEILHSLDVGSMRTIAKYIGDDLKEVGISKNSINLLQVFYGALTLSLKSEGVGQGVQILEWLSIILGASFQLSEEFSEDTLVVMNELSICRYLHMSSIIMTILSVLSCHFWQHYEIIPSHMHSDLDYHLSTWIRLSSSIWTVFNKFYNKLSSGRYIDGTSPIVISIVEFDRTMKSFGCLVLAITRIDSNFKKCESRIRESALSAKEHALKFLKVHTIGASTCQKHWRISTLFLLLLTDETLVQLCCQDYAMKSSECLSCMLALQKFVSTTTSSILIKINLYLTLLCNLAESTIKPSTNIEFAQTTEALAYVISAGFSSDEIIRVNAVLAVSRLLNFRSGWLQSMVIGNPWLMTMLHFSLVHYSQEKNEHNDEMDISCNFTESASIKLADSLASVGYCDFNDFLSCGSSSHCILHKRQIDLISHSVKLTNSGDDDGPTDRHLRLDPSDKNNEFDAQRQFLINSLMTDFLTCHYGLRITKSNE